MHMLNIDTVPLLASLTARLSFRSKFTLEAARRIRASLTGFAIRIRQPTNGLTNIIPKITRHATRISNRTYYGCKFLFHA